jgi:hypothetical protein
MTINRYATRRDGNEADIIRELCEVGCSVLQLNKIDILVGCKGMNFAFEIKTSEGKLKPSQIKLQKEWRGQYDIIRSTEEALKIIFSRTGNFKESA